MKYKFIKELQTLDGLGKRAFPVYQDSDIFGFALPQYNNDGKETIIDAT